MYFFVTFTTTTTQVQIAHIKHHNTAQVNMSINNNNKFKQNKFKAATQTHICTFIFSPCVGK